MLTAENFCETWPWRKQKKESTIFLLRLLLHPEMRLSQFVVVLDTCVLAPMPIMDTLLRLAQEPAFLRNTRKTGRVRAAASVMFLPCWRRGTAPFALLYPQMVQ